MLKGRDVICFSNDWDSDPLSKKHIMLRLARQNRVLWINSIGNRKPTASVHDFRRVVKKLADFTKGHKQVHERIHVYSPIALPFFGSRFARWLNRKVLQWSVRRIARKLGFENPITWTFVPASAEIVGELGETGLVYHCVDEFSEFTGTDKAAILGLEKQLMEKSDYVIVSSDRLYETKKRYNKNTFLVTHGVDVEHFRKACDPATEVPPDLCRINGPVIGFFGLIADWVDLDLIRYLAVSRPDWNFVLIGKVVTDLGIFDGLENIHLLGQKSYDALPAYARGFDVAILPFALNELTIASNPLKLREYLAAGLPVVSTAIPEAERLDHVLHIGRNKLEFFDHLQRIVDSGRTGPQIAISQQMDSETWDHKVEQLSEIFRGKESIAAA
jgi:glycosyltransferase involved in cell wall biosynthesis